MENPTKTGPLTIEDMAQALRDVGENFATRGHQAGERADREVVGSTHDGHRTASAICHAIAAFAFEVADHIEGVNE